MGNLASCSSTLLLSNLVESQWLRAQNIVRFIERFGGGPGGEVVKARAGDVVGGADIVFVFGGNAVLSKEEVACFAVLE